MDVEDLIEMNLRIFKLCYGETFLVNSTVITTFEQTFCIFKKKNLHIYLLIREILRCITINAGMYLFILK